MVSSGKKLLRPHLNQWLGMVVPVIPALREPPKSED
jgi:hypothetical protein